MLTICLHDETNMKQTRNKLKSTRRARVFWIRLLHLCFVFASSCKRGIKYRCVLSMCAV